MSRSRQKRKQAKHQGAKLCLIPLLLAILAYVLWPAANDEEDAAVAATALNTNSVQSTSGTSAGATPAAAPISGRLVTSSASSGVGNDSAMASNKSQLPAAWPKVELGQVGKQSPFASPPIPKPAPVDEAISAETQSTNQPAPSGVAEIEAKPAAPALDLAELSNQPVHYYFQSSKRRVMLVGEHLLAEGQNLDTYTVKQLEPTRIHLQSQGDPAEPAAALVLPLQN